MTKKRAAFITFEGTDGVGKSTQIRLLAEWLRSQYHQVVLTREPGGGKTAELIRSLLLNPRIQMESNAELFLYEAARVEHVERIVRPALGKGVWVLCDRFTDATIAYQGFGRGLSLANIETLNRIATDGLKPDLTIWLDLSVDRGLNNARKRKSGQLDRIEVEGEKFQNRVRTGYRSLAKREPKRIFRITVAAEIQTTQEKIRKLIRKKFDL